MPFRCECDGSYKLVERVRKGVSYHAYVCRRCHEEVLTLSQAEEYQQALALKKALAASRKALKLVRIGNSVKATIPAPLVREGFAPGLYYTVELQDSTTLVLRLTPPRAKAVGE